MDIDVSDTLMKELIDELIAITLEASVNSSNANEYKRNIEQLDKLLFAKLAYRVNGFYCPGMKEYVFELYFSVD